MDGENEEDERGGAIETGVVARLLPREGDVDNTEEEEEVDASWRLAAASLPAASAAASTSISSALTPT